MALNSPVSMKGQFDPADSVMASVFAIAAASTAGIATVSIFNFSLSDVVFSAGGSSVTVATVLALVAFGTAWLTNDVAMDGLKDEYRAAVAVTVILVVGIPTVPGLQSFVTSNDFVALGAIAAQSAGYAAVSYLA